MLRAPSRACRLIRSSSSTKAALFLTEIAGIVLATWGISFWSRPSAIIIGGIVLIAVIELRPAPKGKPLPHIPLPSKELRDQARNAACLINQYRYGVALVDLEKLPLLTEQECYQVIDAARSLASNSSR